MIRIHMSVSVHLRKYKLPMKSLIPNFLNLLPTSSLVQENKYKEAIGFYEPIVKKHYDNILSVSAIVLANLCVSYIMTSQVS